MGEGAESEWVDKVRGMLGHHHFNSNAGFLESSYDFA